jgi:predicted RNA-binding protein YlqC (UPF0109 family)
MEKFTDKEFVSYIVKAIVDNPNDVLIERTVDEMGVLITLQVNPNDMGYVIGKSGSTAKAIRSLLRIVGARNNARVNLKILEPEQGVKKDSIITSSEEVDKIVDDLDI